jgi:hypothetical protein
VVGQRSVCAISVRRWMARLYRLRDVSRPLRWKMVR